MTVSALCWMVLCWNLFLFAPLKIRIQYYQESCQNKEREQARFIKRHKKRALEIRQAEELQAIITVLPKHPYDHINKVIEFCKKNEITMRAWKLLSREHNNQLNVQRYQCSMEGTYDKIVDAFKEIESLGPAVFCNALTMAKEDTSLITTCSIHFLSKVQ